MEKKCKYKCKLIYRLVIATFCVRVYYFAFVIFLFLPIYYYGIHGLLTQTQSGTHTHTHAQTNTQWLTQNAQAIIFLCIILRSEKSLIVILPWKWRTTANFLLFFIAFIIVVIIFVVFFSYSCINCIFLLHSFRAHCIVVLLPIFINVLNFNWNCCAMHKWVLIGRICCAEFLLYAYTLGCITLHTKK